MSDACLEGTREIACFYEQNYITQPYHTLEVIIHFFRLAEIPSLKEQGINEAVIDPVLAKSKHYLPREPAYVSPNPSLINESYPFLLKECQ